MPLPQTCALKAKALLSNIGLREGTALGGKLMLAGIDLATRLLSNIRATQLEGMLLVSAMVLSRACACVCV